MSGTRFSYPLIHPRTVSFSVLIGSFGNGDGDGDGDGDGSENGRKAIGLISKTTTLHVQHTFLYISLPSLHDYDMKMPNFTLSGEQKQATTNFSFPF